MFSGLDLGVFDKYSEAGLHAFSSGVVSEDDKDAYWRIHDSLRQAAKSAIASEQNSQWFDQWSTRFGRDGGVQGQRPVDLWASVINRESDVFGRYPQVYVIASGLGLEIGFSVAIHEDDYYKKNVKLRNRTIVPILYRKLPEFDSEFVTRLDQRLLSGGNWQFGRKTRAGLHGDYGSVSELFEFLKSPESSSKGGGSIYRMLTPTEIDAGEFDLNALFSETVSLFTPLMRSLVPGSNESSHLEAVSAVDHAAENIPEFEPDNIEDGRKKVWASIAIRQGQATFRTKLLEAYESRCAITGTAVPAVLQAAHIVPYNGAATNSVQNGLLLRADIHNLFDLGLIQINPDDFSVSVSPLLTDVEYQQLQGKSVALPKSPSKRPNKKALAMHMESYS